MKAAVVGNPVDHSLSPDIHNFWLNEAGLKGVYTKKTVRDENLTAMKTIKGGSFLCEPDFCHGFRVSSRMGTTPDTSLMHTGFRTAKN